MSPRHPQASAPSPVADRVAAAASGDRGAYDELVRRFQDMAVGTAYGWLRDLREAEDAAQEAFVEVYRNLDRISDPAAFPGFLRRVVLKHCDRRTRGRSGRELRDVADLPDARPGADASLSTREERVRVRAALEGLPRPERLAVSLHYFAGLSQAEVADWLELPLSTVKKRLHTARGRIRDALEGTMSRSFEAMRPSQSPLFSDTIRLFLAIREGDVETASSLLARDPGLCEVEERWSDELTRAHGLPAPNGGTPLVRAAERDQPEMIELLLDRGACVDRACSCAGGESPLWAAVANGRVRAVRLLLERGADPDAAGFAGHTPLHVAALRGFDELVEILCEAGANGRLRDGHGRTPADWARVKGRHAIAERLAARFEGPAASDGRPAQRANAGSARGDRSSGTGIRALDLFAPIVPGALVQTRYDAGVGAVVLLGELSSRWSAAQRPAGSPQGPACLWVGWERRPSDLAEIRHAMDELDLADRIRLVWSPACDDEDTRTRTLERAISCAREIAEEGSPHPLLVVFAQPGRWAEIEAALPALADPGGGCAPLTTIVAEAYGDPSRDAEPLRAPFDARIGFDPALATLGHFPAIHPFASTSRAVVGARHQRVAAGARALLAAHRRLAPDCGDGAPELLDDEERSLVARARRLQAFLTQPFGVGESFTGRLGRGQELDAMLADVEAVLAGALDDVELGRIPYRGGLADIRRAAGVAGGSPLQTVR